MTQRPHDEPNLDYEDPLVLQAEAEFLRENGHPELAEELDDKVNSLFRSQGILSADLPPQVLELGNKFDKYLLSGVGGLPPKDIFASADPEAFGRANTMGHGPISLQDLDEALAALEVVPMNCKSQVEVVICGREGWDPDDFDYLIKERRGKKLRIYSQEMFFFWVNQRRDPYDCGSLWLFGLNHPALQFLMTNNFEWPSCHVDPSHGGLAEFGSIEVGVLKRMGYEVGKGGINSSAEREVILERVFSAPCLPPVGDFNHMREWGTAKSATRLHKMAEAISSFARNAAHRRDNHMAQAIQHWREDLDFLREHLYKGYFDGSFRWPCPDVR